MKPFQILNEIVMTEQAARKYHEDAEKLQDDYEEDVRQKISELRTEELQKLEEQIAVHEKQEIERADAGILKTDAELQTALEDAKDFFLKNKERIAEKIFEKVVHRDAE